MKKFIALILSLIVVLSLCACEAKTPAQEEPAADEPSGSATLANPMQEISADQMDIPLNVPAEASDVHYFVYTSDEAKLFEVRFKLGEKDAYARAKETSDLEPSNFSGLNYTFTESDAEVDGRAAKIYLCEECGALAFLDVVPGIAYNFCINAAATADELISLAQSCFTAVQGEVG